MSGTNPMVFVYSLGPGFGIVFLILTVLAIFLYITVRGDAARLERMAHGVLTARAEPDEIWRKLVKMKAALQANATRANLTTASIPVLALLGTCLGFFHALLAVGDMDLSGADPLAILEALMNGGVDTALATTVCGQGIYFLLGQIWSITVAKPLEAAVITADEALAIVRARLPSGQSLQAPPEGGEV